VPKNPAWTAADEQLLREHHGNGTSREEIAKLLGRTVISIKTRIGRLGLGKDRTWSEADKQFAVEQRGKLKACEIGAQLGRTVRSIYQLWNKLNVCERRRDGRPLQLFILEKHPLGWSDAEIAAAWTAANPTEPACREWVMEVRRDKLKLPSNALSEHRRRKVAAKTREQVAAAGVNNLAEVRRLAYDKFASRHGWPADLRPRAVQIMDLLYQKGPHTRRQIADAIGMPWKGTRKSLHSNDPEGSYLAHLMARGLVVVTKRAHKVHGQGTGKSCDVYAIAPHVTRGPICPLNEKTSA
jgi:hypothetical protein